MKKVNNNGLEYWNEYYKNHANDEIITDNWLDRFKEVINTSERPIIDLGCGSGNNTLYLLNHGKSVIPCDGSVNAIFNIMNRFPQIKNALYFDMLDEFPIDNNTADLIIADLCLHYFKKEDTIKILKEIKRILVNHGNLLVRVNSIDDINYGAGKGVEVERHLYMMPDGRYKRFFDGKDIYDFFRTFEIKYVRENLMTRYEQPKKAYVLGLKNRK